MSVDMTHYFGIGVKLVDEEINDFDPLHDLEDKYPECSAYEFIRRNASTKSNVRIITDGMNGLYAYLMYLVKETYDEEIWTTECSAEFSIDQIDDTEFTKLKEVYKTYTGYDLQDSDLKIISLFHFS